MDTQKKSKAFATFAVIMAVIFGICMCGVLFLLLTLFYEESMPKTYACPDCGAKLHSKRAKCPYKTKRKPIKSSIRVPDLCLSFIYYLLYFLCIFMFSVLIGFIIS